MQHLPRPDVRLHLRRRLGGLCAHAPEPLQAVALQVRVERLELRRRGCPFADHASSRHAPNRSLVAISQARLVYPRTTRNRARPPGARVPAPAPAGPPPTALAPRRLRSERPPARRPPPVRRP